MATEVVHSENLKIEAADGFALAATLHRSPAERGTCVVVNSATAAPRQFYQHYAAALAERGFATVTYDYRGIGGSRPKSLRGFRASMGDWVFSDMTGVLDWVRLQGHDKLLIIGHSFGGQTPGLLKEKTQISGMLALSAQSGHWRVQGGSQRLPVLFHTHVTLRVLPQFFGYMPWSRFGSAEDLPKGVAVEWARWCRNRHYLLDDPELPVERYAEFTAPVRAYSIADDDWGSAPSVDEMMSAYPNVERQHIEPRQHGLDRMGHFGYFRPKSAALWQRDFAWLASL
ncbi:MAG: alpha/beta fold hydrolase [Pseudomonadota bacterium]